MNDDKAINYKTEYNRLIHELSKFEWNYAELENDRDYIQSLLDAEFEKGLELKKEKERWKSIACNNSSFNSILLHELDIAQEQGYKLSDPFKKLMREKNE